MSMINSNDPMQAWLRQKNHEYFDAKDYLEGELSKDDPELDFQNILFAIEACHPNPKQTAELRKTDRRQQIPGLTPGMGSLKMLRDMLSLCEKVKNDRLKLNTLTRQFLNNNFLSEETLSHYKDYITVKSFGMKLQPRELPLIVQDLTRWVNIQSSILQQFPTRLGFVPAEELLSISSLLENQVQEQTALAFTDQERLLGERYYALLKSAKELQRTKSLMEIRKGPTLENAYDSDQAQSHDGEDEDYEPPNDFRSLPVNPTLDDLIDNNPFLSPIVLKKGFESLEHYLDVNFRLLREDFCGELRDGFRELKRNEAPDNSRNHHLNYYQDVSCLGVFASITGVFGLELNIKLPPHFKLPPRGKFMYGQLVVLSADDFEQSVYIGVIRESDRAQMTKELEATGAITLKVELLPAEMKQEVFGSSSDDSDDYYYAHRRQVVSTVVQASHSEAFNNLQDKRLTMIESKVYFEAYAHVLKSLQNTHQIPLLEQIVHTKFTHQQAPSRWSSQENQWKIKKFKDSSTMDETQKAAFHLAFNSPVALIQGPPGTGKTFAGAHIVEAILEISKLSIGLSCGPILLTCLTNHALDQFLEHCLKFTTKVIRLGGRAKEELREYTIQAYAKTHGYKLSKDYYAHFDLVRDSVDRYNALNMQIVRSQFCPLPSMKQVDMSSFKLSSLVKTSLPEFRLSITQVLEEDPDLDDYLYGPIVEAIGSPYLLYWLGAFDPSAMRKAYANEGVTFHQEEKVKNEDEDFIDIPQEMDKYIEQLEGLSSSSDLRAKYDSLCSMPLLVHPNKREEFEAIGILNYGDLFRGIRTARSLTLMEKTSPGTVPSLQQKFRILKECSKTKVDEVIILRELEREIKSSAKEMEIIKANNNQVVLESADIIAMTTTGAAKYKKYIQNLSSEIMIIEEAAEILEAHITSALPENLQQLILIGDHKQLRPGVNVMELASTYNLDVSMFERLILGGIEHVTLNTQRRMRPEISSVIRTLYPTLEDHKNVEEYPNIKGVGSNYFFFNHQFPELDIKDASKVNPEEAQMVLRFAYYLFQQGYKPSQITILSLYAGQLLHIKTLLARESQFEEVKEVNVQTVDNFQGEENDIVILSLVRNNPTNTIGFLKISNRVNVALSRARWGLFIFGNAGCLRDGVRQLQEKHSNEMGSANDTGDMTGDIWLKVLGILNERKQIIDRLEISCPTHKKRVEVIAPEDFLTKTPGGGCDEPCGIRMECGHVCTSLCHPLDKSEEDPTGHNNVTCFKPCSRPTDCIHPCSYKCYECKKGHLPCEAQVVEHVPKCGHYFETTCEELTKMKASGRVLCQAPCDKILPCRHKCQKLCFVDCKAHLKQGYTSNCKERVLKKLSCGHDVEIDCGQPVQLYESTEGCSRKCEAILECGHQCPNRCGTCKDQLFHGDCQEKCGRVQFCNHECKDNCSSSDCSPCQKDCAISCSHSRCNQKCGQVCPPCRERCQQRCVHSRCNRYCFEECDRLPCDQACPQKLRCGHPCIGFCGETCPSVCRVDGCELYDSSVFELLFGNEDEPEARFVLLEDCGHPIEADALESFVEMQGSSSSSIKYPECPKCKTQIQNCNRLGNQIKRVTAKINKVKSKVLTGIAELRKQILDLKLELPVKLQISLGELHNTLLLRKEKMATEHKALAPFRMSTLLSAIQLYNRIKDCLERSISPSKDEEVLSIKAKTILRKVIKELKKPELSNERLQVMSNIIYLAETQWILNSFRQDKVYGVRIKDMQDLIEAREFILGEQELKQAKQLVADLKSKGKLTISEKELIIKAVGLSRGHWYECPNGHPYAIGECGGAMEQAQCPECSASIGGTGHRLEETNRQASSFAGQARPAWDPDNYNLNLQAALRLQRELVGLRPPKGSLDDMDDFDDMDDMEHWDDMDNY